MRGEEGGSKVLMEALTQDFSMLSDVLSMDMSTKSTIATAGRQTDIQGLQAIPSSLVAIDPNVRERPSLQTGAPAGLWTGSVVHLQVVVEAEEHVIGDDINCLGRLSSSSRGARTSLYGYRIPA
jgi:hypothetical protein